MGTELTDTIGSALRQWAALALTALAVGAQAQSPSTAPPPYAPLDVAGQAGRLAWWGDLDGLERLYTEVNQPGRYTTQGNVLLQDFRRRTDDVFSTPKDTGSAFMAEIDAMTLAWAEQRPMLPMVHWLRAQALINRGWEVRGSGLAKEVPQRAWAEFRSHLDGAVQHLARTAAVSLLDSSAYRELIIAGRGLDWDQRRIEQLAAAGLQRNPDDLGLWHQLVTGSLPKWGGSAALVDRTILRAAGQYRDRGDEIYARLYVSAAEEEFSHNVFNDSAADWPRIRKGLRDSIGRWPAKAVFWNRLAYFACLKEDRDTLTEALDSIQNKPDLDQWGKNPRRVFEACQKLGRQS